MHARVVVPVFAAAAAVLAGPASAQAATPKRVAAAGGIYTGTAQVPGVCSKCRVRIELTTDGLEIEPTSDITVPESCTAGNFTPARVRTDGTFTAAWESVDASLNRVRGRFSGDGRRVSGTARIPCGDGDTTRTARFSARRTGTVKRPAASATVECNRLERGKTVATPYVRGLGCGLAHDATRAVLTRAGCRPSALAAGGTCSVSGVRCRREAAQLAPAANVVCRAGAVAGPRVEILPLTACGSVADRYEPLAGPGVGCKKAREVATARSDEDCELTACPDVGFTCKLVEGGVLAYPAAGRDPLGRHLDPYEACVDRAAPARIVEIEDQSSDSV